MNYNLYKDESSNIDKKKDLTWVFKKRVYLNEAKKAVRGGEKMNRAVGMAAGVAVIIGVGSTIGCGNYRSEKKPESSINVSTTIAKEQKEVTPSIVADDPTVTRQLDEVMTKDKVQNDLKFMMVAFQMYHPAWGKDGDEELVERVNKQYDIELEKLPS